MGIICINKIMQRFIVRHVHLLFDNKSKVVMTNIYLLDNIVMFLPGKNLLISLKDDTQRLSLSNPATRCLLLLIQHHGQVVARDHFFQHVWENNGAQVTNNAFYQNISLLRRAFKEFGLNDEWIVTVPKVGVKLESLLHIGIQQEDELEPPAQVVAVVKPRVRRPSGKVCVALVIMISCLITAVLTWRSEFDSRFADYVPLENKNGCHYYANADVLNYDKHQQVIDSVLSGCQNYPWAYITVYPNFSRVSVLMCREQYSQWHENTCVMRYIFMEDRHVPA